MPKMDTKSKENNFKHYFVSQEHKEEDYFSFKASFNGKEYTFRSCKDVFSKEELDYGSLVLVNTIRRHKELFSGEVLDMCCGYGTIGILISEFIKCNIDMCDINSTAVELAKINAKQNKANISEIFESDLFAKVTKKYNHIVSNPPIKVGKKVLLSFVDGSYNHLEDGGTLSIVIKKNLGADSTKKYITNLQGDSTKKIYDLIREVLENE